MKFKTTQSIPSLLAQLPPDAVTTADLIHLKAANAFLKTLRAEPPEGATYNLFPVEQRQLIATALTAGLVDIIETRIADARREKWAGDVAAAQERKRDGRRLDPAVAAARAQTAQSINNAQTYQGRTKLLKEALTAYKKAVTSVPEQDEPERRGRIMRPAFEQVTKAFYALLDLVPPSGDARDTTEEMKTLHAKLERSVEQYATEYFMIPNKASGPANELALVHWITACSTLSTQTAEAIRDLKNPS